MANVKFGLNFVDPSGTGIYTVTAEDPVFPATNLFDREFPLRPFRTTTAGGGEVVRFEVATSPNIKAIYIRHTNCPSIQVRSSNTSGTFGGGLDVDSTVVPVKDKRVGRYNYFLEVDSNDQYFQLLFNGTPTDGSSVYSVGSVYLVTTLTELNHTEQFPFGIRRSQANIRSNRSDGSSNIIDFLKPKIILTFPAELAALADAAQGWAVGGEDQLHSIYEASLNEGVLFFENRDRDNNEKFARAYHVRVTDDTSFTYPGLDAAIQNDLELEEVI